MADDGQRDRASRLRAGIVLLAVGVILLLGQITQQPLWSLLGLGILFLVAYFATREYGFLVPGGILVGLGVGLLLQVRGGADANPAVFMVPFGLGFVAIWVLDRLYSRESNWWPLVPGGALVAVGLALKQGGAALDLLETAGVWWPVILIAIGGWFLFDLYRERGAKSAAEPPSQPGADKGSDSTG